MAMMIGTQVPSKRHRHELVESDAALPRKKACLTPQAFGKVVETPSVQLKVVCGANAKADFYSPKAENLCVPIADHTLVRYCQRFDKFNLIDNADLGCFGDGNAFIFRQVSGNAADLQYGWHVGCCHCPGSCIIAWEVSLEPIPGHDGCFSVGFQNRCTEPSILPVVSWEHIVAREFAWRSPAYQLLRFTAAPTGWHKQVRAIVESSHDLPLRTVAAQQGWWKLDVRALRAIGAHLGMPLLAKVSLFDALVALTTKTLRVSEADAMALLGPRLAAAHSDTAVVEELLELDEAAKLLNREDAEELDREKKKQVERQATEQEFVREYRQRRMVVRAQARAAAAEAEAAEAKGRKGKNRKKQVEEAAPVLPPADLLDHEIAKRFVPPQGYIWRNMGQEAWQGRVKPFGSVSRNWNKYGGSNYALREVLVSLWKTHCEAEGISPAECPMVGVFEQEAQIAPASAAASSSSR